jgi:hypothetical protein
MVPEVVEDAVFADPLNMYESYPRGQDIDNMAKWVFEFVCTYGLKGQHFVCYSTAAAFREACELANVLLNTEGKRSIQILPREFDTRKAIFEFRKKTKVRELWDFCAQHIKNNLLQHYL